MKSLLSVRTSLLLLSSFASGTGAQKLKDLADNLGLRAYGLCEGDCDQDSDCKFGLSCFQRTGTTTVPGCSGKGIKNNDYCHIPPAGRLVLAGDDGQPSAAYPLGKCKGDCDWDGDCEGLLMCFERTGTQAVPGCTGTGQSGSDYCYDAGAIITTLRVVGNNGSPASRYPIRACQGDCDSDSNCMGDLVCFQREGLEEVPGCTGSGVAGTDYCHIASMPAPVQTPTKSPVVTTFPPEPLKLQDIGDNGSPLAAFPLGECEGDCDVDTDCEGELKCFKRSGLQPVPGCTGFGITGHSYCYGHYTGYGALVIIANNGVPALAYPLQVCQGDCDADSDCAAGLYCYQRDSDSVFVPGCEGSVHVHSDYCINVVKPPAQLTQPTFAPVAPSPTLPGTTYRPGEATVLMEGLLLSTGLRARKIATMNQKVRFDTGGESAELFHSVPDGAAVFVNPAGSGEYVYVSNSESPVDGGVGAIRFNAQGQVVGYKRLLFRDPTTGVVSKARTVRNCGGGKTYWGTWMTCEEWNAGQVWEVDPWGNEPGRMTRMGGAGRAYESAAYDKRDPFNPKFFVTTDELNGPLVKYTPAASVASAAVNSGNYSQLLHSPGGTHEYFKITSIGLTDGSVTGTYVWTSSQAEGNASAAQHHIQGEGIDIRDGKLYYTTKAQKYLYIIDLDGGTFTRSSTYSGAFDSQPDQVARVLDFVDGTTNGILYFCEDGGNQCGVHGRDAQGRFFTILQAATGAYSGETTGLAFSPNGKFMYVSFQSPGIIFEISRRDGMPFYGGTLDIKYHADTDQANSFRMLQEDNAKTCDLNAEMCLLK